jgi:hypothetical protein
MREGSLTSNSSKVDEEFGELLYKRYLKDYRWLIELARLHSFPLMVLDQVVKTVEKSPHITSEKERFSFGLIVDKPGLSLAPADIKVDPFHISKTSRLSDLKDAVGGVHSCYLLDKLGMLTVVKVPEDCKKETAPQTVQEISAKSHTLAFHMDIDIARAYSNGNIVRTWRKGVWLETPRLTFDELVKEGYPEALLSDMVSLCVNMSESRKPAILVVQKSDSIESCRPFREIQFNECELDSIPRSQLVGYADMDGAVIITKKGRVLGIAQMLISYREIGDEFGGARHTSASRYSAEHECVIFVVSSDGPISIFKGGTLWARLFSELKP